MTNRRLARGISISTLRFKDLRHPDVVWATAFGLGFLKPAPGTWGSAGGLAVWWFWLSALPPWQQGLIIVVYFLAGWWCSERVGSRHQIKDASAIVADEVAGMWLALMLMPRLWWVALCAFLLFRLLDIAKPGPIGWLDRTVGGGLGVMADDLLAGLITGGVLWAGLSL